MNGRFFFCGFSYIFWLIFHFMHNYISLQKLFIIFVINFPNSIPSHQLLLFHSFSLRQLIKMLPNSAIIMSKRFVTAKVRVEDEESMQQSLFILTDSQGLLTKSEEIFFRVPAGQLKLRLAHPGKDIGSLIASSSRQVTHHQTYKLNIWEVRISEVSAGSNQLRHTLALALDELAILRKKRRTFTLGHSVHIHLDDVEGLGSFLDIEIHPSHAGEENGTMFSRAADLLRRMHIANNALVPHSYLELYQDKMEQQQRHKSDREGAHQQQQQEEREKRHEVGEEEEGESDESAFFDESVPPSSRSTSSSTTTTCA